MTLPIYERVWHDIESHLHHHPDEQPHSVTITTNTTIKGAPTMSLAALANDIKTALEDGDTRIRTVLDEHMPTLAALAEKVENDPLIQAAEAAALPPGARALVADFISKLGAEFPAAPAAEPAPSGITPADASQTVPAEPAPAQ